MAVASPINQRWTVGALLGLTAVTGLIDAVSYLRLGRVFVANMTGNVVFLGFSLHPHSGLSALSSVVALSGFLLGALAGGRLGVGLDPRPRVWLCSVLVLQAALIGTVSLFTATGVFTFDGRRNLIPIVILAMAMGLQNSTVRRLGAPDLTTTVLTLTLTGIAADSALAGGSGAKAFRRVGSVVAMVVGAGAGAALLSTSASAVIALAAVLVLVIAGCFRFGPVA
jgi:uncharacterized membrane protein YoaK (UPF0700 family)